MWMCFPRDPEEPASRITSLFEGHYKVLEEFRRYGVDVSSEALRYAFLGKVSYYWNMPNPAPVRSEVRFQFLLLSIGTVQSGVKGHENVARKGPCSACFSTMLGNIP
jgi:hypothetical protein